jgi:hypothetical protein
MTPTAEDAEPAEPSVAALSLSGGNDDIDGAPPVVPELPLPAEGARVRCEGLTSAAELNGCLGRVVDHEGARVRVRLDGPGGRVVGVKPQNLAVVVGFLDLLKEKVLFKEEVLRRLDPTDRAMLRRVNRAFRAAVGSSSDLSRAGITQEVPLKLNQFVGSIERLAWWGGAS